MSDRISVIVPCYNRQEYIRECVDSLLSQSYPLSDIELIFVDDASTDNTVDILKEYEGRHPDNIIIVTNVENSGYAGKMRNIGMQYASGEYITFVDSDDIVSPEYLSCLHDIITKNEADVAVGSMVIFGNGGKELSRISKIKRVYDTSVTSDFQELLAIEENNAGACGKLFKADFIFENGIAFSETVHISEDYFFTMQCFFKAKRFCTTDDVLYFYRRNESGLWFNKKPKGNLLDAFMTQVNLYDLYLSRLDEVWELVEWFFYAAAVSTRRKALYTGLQDEYVNVALPYIRSSIAMLVPGMKNNRFVLQRRDEEAEKVYEELFG